MSPTVLRRIVFSLGIVVALWLLLALIRRSSTDHPEAMTLPRLSPAEADRIVYAGPADTVRLVRDSTGWQVNGHPAAAPEIDAFFKALADTTARSELVARNAASHVRLGVDSAKAKRVSVLSAGKVLLDLWVGNRGPDFDGFYVRRDGDDRVYLLRGTFANLTVQGTDDWREKRILRLAGDSIRAVEVTRGKEHYRLERADSGWRATPGTVADSARVNRLVAALADLTASGFPDSVELRNADFRPAERQVALFGPGGGPLALIELDSVTAGWVGRLGPGGEPFRLSPGTVDQIAPAQTTLQR